MTVVGPILKGRVKWFDAAKEYGFVVSEQSERDILLHANVLRNFGLSSIPEGAEVELRVQSSAKGFQAVEVVSVEAPEDTGSTGLEDLDGLTSEEVQAMPLLPARVKWFDKAKGFGFANVFGKDADIFVHIEVLRRSGFAELLPGEAVALRTIEGRRGLMAIEVVLWDMAIERS